MVQTEFLGKKGDKKQNSTLTPNNGTINELKSALLEKPNLQNTQANNETNQTNFINLKMSQTNNPTQIMLLPPINNTNPETVSSFPSTADHVSSSKTNGVIEIPELKGSSTPYKNMVSPSSEKHNSTIRTNDTGSINSESLHDGNALFSNDSNSNAATDSKSSLSPSTIGQATSAQTKETVEDAYNELLKVDENEKFKSTKGVHTNKALKARHKIFDNIDDNSRVAYKRVNLHLPMHYSLTQLKTSTEASGEIPADSSEVDEGIFANNRSKARIIIPY